MHTLALSGGDLVATAAGHATADGATMIRQNLACALGEPVGTDRFHPSWGSTLQAMVGTPLDASATAGLRAETVRVVQAMIAAQGAVIAADAAVGARSRYSAADVIARLKDVQIGGSLDTATVVVKVTSGAGAQVGVASLAAV